MDRQKVKKTNDSFIFQQTLIKTKKVNQIGWINKLVRKQLFHFSRVTRPLVNMNKYHLVQYSL